MAGPSNRRDDLSEAMYSVIDLDAMGMEDEDLPNIDDFARSPTSSGPSSRPSSRGRGDRHQARQQKRREQNKAAQRSFRARKEQHLSEIITRIESLELRKKTIEDENRVLMHELLRKRAENNLLRSNRRYSSSHASSAGGGGGGGGTWEERPLAHATLTRQPSHVLEQQQQQQQQQQEASSSSARAQGKRPVREFPGAAEQRARRSRTLPVESLMWLYGPFLDVWNLIKEQPAVVRGDVDVDEVVERLKEMAKYEDQASGNQAGSEGGPRNSVAAIVRQTRQRARSL